MILKVLQIHINVAGFSCRHCVVAHALNDVLKPEYKAFVTCIGVHIFTNETIRDSIIRQAAYSVPMNRRLADYVEAWDLCRTVQPSEFEIDIPPQYLRAS